MITFDREPGSYKHWRLTFDGPVATLALDVNEDAGIDEGYLLLHRGNGQADSTTEFMFAVTLGYEIRGGRLGRAIRDALAATGVDAVAIGEASVASHANSVALGAGSVTTADNQVNVGGRTIGGLAAGELSATSTDAVNGSQLYATNQAVAAMDTRVDALELMAVDFDEDLRSLDRKLDGSTAVAIAMSGNAFLPNKSFNLTGNVGYYQGAVAGALQIGALVSPNAAFNAGVSTNFNKKGGVGARAGFTFGW